VEDDRSRYMSAFEEIQLSDDELQAIIDWMDTL
jgi:cytochrome c5